MFMIIDSLSVNAVYDKALTLDNIDLINAMQKELLTDGSVKNEKGYQTKKQFFLT